MWVPRWTSHDLPYLYIAIQRWTYRHFINTSHPESYFVHVEGLLSVIFFSKMVFGQSKLLHAGDFLWTNALFCEEIFWGFEVIFLCRLLINQEQGILCSRISGRGYFLQWSKRRDAEIQASNAEIHFKILCSSEYTRGYSWGQSRKKRW